MHINSDNFYRAASMHGGLRHEQNVCLSVRPSVKRMDCDKTKESSAKVLTPQERTIIPVL